MRRAAVWTAAGASVGVVVLAAASVVTASNALRKDGAAKPVIAVASPESALGPTEAGLPFADVSSDDEETLRLTRLLKLRTDEPGSGPPVTLAALRAGGLSIVSILGERVATTLISRGAGARAPPVYRVYGRLPGGQA